MRPIFLALLLLATPNAQDRPLPDYETFAAQVKIHLATDEERQSGYMFTERRVDQNHEAAGAPPGPRHDSRRAHPEARREAPAPRREDHAPFQGASLDQRIGLRAGACRDRSHRRPVIRPGRARPYTQGHGRDVRAPEGEQRSLAARGGHVDRERAGDAAEAPAASQRVGVLQLPQVHRGYLHNVLATGRTVATLTAGSGLEARGLGPDSSDRSRTLESGPEPPVPSPEPLHFTGLATG